MDLSALNEVGKVEEFLPTKKLRDLELGKQHLVSNLKIVRTKYGARVLIEIANEFVVFLPERIFHVFEHDNNDLLRKTVKTAEEGHLALIFHGGKYNSLEFTNV